MTDARHKTVIEIGIDDKAVRGLGQTMGRTFDDKTLRTFEMAVERTARTMDKLLGAATKLDAIMKSVARSGGAGPGGGGSRSRGGGGPPDPPYNPGGGGGGGGGGPSREDETRRQQAIRSRIEQAGSAIGGGSALSGALGAIPYVGGFFSGAIQQVQQLYQEHAQVQTARARAYGQTGRASSSLDGTFARHGYSAGEGAGMLGNFAQQTGLRGGRLDSETVQGLLNLQTRAGISNAGSLIGASGTAGGSQDMKPLAEVYDAIESGLTAGIRVSRIDQYLSQMASSVEQLRTGGFNINPSTISTLTRQMGEATLQGENATARALSITQAITHQGRDGSVASRLALQAAGFTGGPEGRSYMDARDRLETHPEEILPNILEHLHEMFRDITDPDEHRDRIAQVLQREGQGLGLGDLSTRNARAFAEANYEAMRRAGTPEYRQVNDLLEGGRQVEGLGTAVTEASHRNRRAAIGGSVAGTATRLRDTDLDITQTWITEFGGVVDVMVDSVRELAAAFRDGGFTALLRALAGFGGDHIPGLPGGIPGVPGTAGPRSDSRRGANQSDATGPAPARRFVPSGTPDDPGASAIDALRRAGDANHEAAGHLERMGLTGEAAVTSYG